MSLQVFLQAQVFGTEQFLAVEAANADSQNGDLQDFVGRCSWLSLLCEVLPRALLSELKLSRMLLGSSSAEQFFLVLAEEVIPQANEFLTKAADAMAHLSGDTLRLVWASTENLGAWPIARKRLDDALRAKVSAPLAQVSDIHSLFGPFTETAAAEGHSYFSDFGKHVGSAARVGWSRENPGHLTWDTGEYSWPLREQSSPEDDGILFLRKAALNDAGLEPASLTELAGRSEGAPKWGVLRGDVDQFEALLRRVNTIEEHIHLSAMFKEFFAGELGLLWMRLPDFSRKVTILYRGGDDFAVLGTWDALVLLARELQRLFEKFIEANEQSFPGLEARTLSMSLEICPDLQSPLAAVFQEAGLQLRAAKSTEAGSFHLFGRTLEWKRLTDAEELKAGLVRLVHDFRFPADYINDLASVYREAFSARAGRRGKAIRVDKPWRTYMRLASVIPQARGKELNNVRNAVITNLVGKRTAGFKLRPSARVGLEWARLAAGNQA